MEQHSLSSEAAFVDDDYDQNFSHTALCSVTRQVINAHAFGHADRFIPQRDPRRWQALTKARSGHSTNGRLTNFANVSDLINLCQNSGSNDRNLSGTLSAITRQQTGFTPSGGSVPASMRVPSPILANGRTVGGVEDNVISGGSLQPQLYSRLVTSEIFDFGSIDMQTGSVGDNNQENQFDSSLTKHAHVVGMLPPPLSATSSLNAVVINSYGGGAASFVTPVKRGVLTYSPTRDKPRISPYSLSPLNERTVMLIKSPRRTVRKISKAPYKVLDAPDLQDDFYLNLIDWSAQNVLAVGLGSAVYLWSATTSQVTKLCDYSADHTNSVTSVSWNEKGSLLAVGTGRGSVEIWDIHKQRCTISTSEHCNRVGAMAWNGDVLATGSRDRNILLSDIRCVRNSGDNSTSLPSPPWSQPAGVAFDSSASADHSTINSSFVRRLQYHKQEVCGLRWSPDRVHLASGGNDNRLVVWSPGHSLGPMQIYSDHSAAVKAIAWSPHHHGLLASGGGTADRTIRFWNTLTQQSLQFIDTGSQVCNIAWSRYSSELVSTHGYSQNQILVWKYPNLQQVAKLTGHTFRVLYLACAPDGESIVTGAGDETLRFWHVFSKSVTTGERRSCLDLNASLR